MNHMNETSKSGPKDVFGHLLVIIGLYVSVISFGALLFGLINIYFPDVLSGNYGHFGEQSLKWPLAILVIVFPLYVWLTSYIEKDVEKNPGKKELRARKWLLHLTLFIAAIVIIIDLITLIFRFLNGDLTAQFVLKVLAVLAIALAVFTYYIWTIRKNISATKHPMMRLFVYGVLSVGTFFIIFGFTTSGSPFAERLKRFDERRTGDLQTLQYEIINYWQAKEVLPQTLENLRDDIRGFTPPIDPESGEEYGYKVVSARQFELCATFTTTNKEDFAREGEKSSPLPVQPYGVAYNENWLHDSGLACFSRTIDPDLYPPYKQRLN